MFENKGLSELHAMQEVLNLVFRRVAKAEEEENIWSILADISMQIEKESEECFRLMEDAERWTR